VELNPILVLQIDMIRSSCSELELHVQLGPHVGMSPSRHALTTISNRPSERALYCSVNIEGRMPVHGRGILFSVLSHLSQRHVDGPA
jgi:hypothetical protein